MMNLCWELREKGISIAIIHMMLYNVKFSFLQAPIVRSSPFWFQLIIMLHFQATVM